ncbi:MAG: hypothetical protein JW809_18605 [Pirellulales bacterium]|nr:hypothetical protein [Pirellulales bacterium]
MRYMALALALVWCWMPSAAFAAEEATPPPLQKQLCDLRIQGEAIDLLVLVEKNNLAGVQFARPGKILRLPPGRYRVQTVDVAGGFRFDDRGRWNEGWFDLTPDQPGEIAVGAPLSSRVSVTRHGTFLQLDYALVDAEGRPYDRFANNSPWRRAAPMFSIHKDGKEIGSGSFEYG